MDEPTCNRTPLLTPQLREQLLETAAGAVATMSR
jgi:hypothetical protein